MASAPNGLKTTVIAIPAHSPTATKRPLSAGPNSGFREEVGVEIGEVETMLGEVRKTFGLVPHDLHEFLYTEIEELSIIFVHGNNVECKATPPPFRTASDFG